jgi:hypothetical protein
MKMKFKSAAAALAAALLAAGAAHAEIVHFSADLTGAQEVPPNSSAGKGQVIAELETNEHTLTYRVTYSGLTGTPTMAHFHGPAAPGADAPPQVTVPDPVHISGAVLLTAEQTDELMAGKWYFNIHTQANPTGEIRGQLKPLNSTNGLQ